MQQHLEIKRLVAIVGNDERSGQALFVQDDAVQEREFIGPEGLGRVGEPIG